MSSLKLYGSTSGYVEIVPEATAGNNSVTLPNTAGSIAVKDASGNLEVGTGVTIAAPSSDTFTVSTNGSERIRIDSSGRFGLGTSSPSQPLEVVTATGGGIAIRPSAGNATQGLLWYDTGSGPWGFIKYDHQASALSFGTVNNERARIDSSGRLLIGTPSARANYFNSTFTSTLQIEGTGYSTSTASITCNNASSSIFPIFILGKSNGASIGSNTIVSSGDVIGLIDFQGNDGSEFVEAATIKAEVDGAPGANDMPGRLVFSTTVDGASSPTARMRISSYGRIDTFDSSGACIQATSSLAAGTSNYIFIGRYAGTAFDTGVACYAIYTNGSFQQLSDANLKKNIETTRGGYLDDLNKLRVVKYNWKNQEDGDPKELGLVAQEVESIFPGLVSEMDSETENSSKGIKTSVLPYMLIKALQEATERIETLEAKVAVLEGN